MYIANSLIVAGGARYKPGDVVPRLDDIERLIALGFVVVAGGAEEYAEPEREAAETEQKCPETASEGVETEQEAAEPEQECPGDEEPEEAVPVQESAPPVIGRQSQQGKKFGRKK